MRELLDSMQPGKNTDTRAKPASGRGLVLVDERPIREAALDAYHSVKRELEEVEARLEGFREKEVPAFRMWLHKELGQTLSRVRDLEERHAEESALHAEILRERDRRGGSFHAAWQRVKARREAGSPEPDDFIHRAWQNEQARYERQTGPAMLEEAPAHGDWENLSDQEFEKMAEAFLAVANAIAKAEDDPSYIEAANEVVKRQRRRRDGGGRIKHLYRRLVRLLHPDANSELNESQRRLWEDVQEAYRSGNETQLELLLHRVDSADEHMPASASVSLIREITEQTREALAGVRLQLLYAQEDPAWGFFAKKGRALAALRKRMQKSLEGIAEGMRGAISELRMTLKRWASPAEPATAGRRRKKKKAAEQDQAEFGL